MPDQKVRSNIGKRVVLVMLAVSLLIAFLRWKFIPKSNPKQADPGSPYYSPPDPGPVPPRGTGGAR
jgi:hypothetical protein